MDVATRVSSRDPRPRSTRARRPRDRRSIGSRVLERVDVGVSRDHRRQRQLDVDDRLRRRGPGPMWNPRGRSGPRAQGQRVGDAGGFVLERGGPRGVVVGELEVVAPARGSRRGGRAIPAAVARFASASNSDCCTRSVAAVSSGCHCTPEHPRESRPRSGRSYSCRGPGVRSPRPGRRGCDPLTTRPRPTSSTPWWWWDEHVSDPDLVVAESRVPGSGATGWSVSVSSTGHPVRQQARAGRAGADAGFRRTRRS